MKQVTSSIIILTYQPPAEPAMKMKKKRKKKKKKKKRKKKKMHLYLLSQKQITR